MPPPCRCRFATVVAAASPLHKMSPSHHCKHEPSFFIRCRRLPVVLLLSLQRCHCLTAVATFFFFFFLLPPLLPLLPSSFLLPPLFFHCPFYLSLFFFLVKPPVCTDVPCVNTLVQTGMYHSNRLPKRVRYPKRQTLMRRSRKFEIGLSPKKIKNFMMWISDTSLNILRWASSIS